MNRLKRIWFIFTLIICLSLLLLGAAPHLYLIVLRDKLTGASRRLHRQRVYSHGLVWSDLILAAFRRLTKFEIEYRLPRTGGSPPPPAITIVNHRSSFDLLLAMSALRRMGYAGVRTVAKREVLRMPVLGRTAKDIECALVTRSRDPEDIARIEQSALGAAGDSVCIMIFPEGTTYGDEVIHTKSDIEYRHVLPPRFGGVEAIRRVLPGHPVLSMTIDWKDIVGAYNIFRLYTMIGKKMVIEAEFLRDLGDKPVSRWLTEEWRRKDLRLARI